MKSENPSPNRKRKKRGSIFGKLIKWSFISLVVYCIWSCWDIYRVGHSDDGSSADCAIVLGAAAWHKKPSPVFAARLDHAIDLYHEGRVKQIVLTGGKGAGAPFAESEVAYTYCLEKGVKEEHLSIETVSLTTQENLTEANRLMRGEDLKTALLVSDPWHLKRAMLMAEDLDMFVKASATKTSKYQSLRAKSSFLLRELFYVQIYRVLGE